MKYLIFYLTTLCVLVTGCEDSNLNDSKIEDIEALFEGYNKSNSPGYALGIIQEGKLRYSKGFGQANLDYAIPLTDSSAFYIGSMAKQFTTAALLILEAEEKLDFEKEIQVYLPEFPRYSDPIRLYHLVHHTSGLRETNSLQLFKGVNSKFEEHFDTDDLYQLLLNQKEPNFPPGTEYRYSSGGYVVLAKIIEKISGKSFRSFLKEKIFDPLNMTATLVSDRHNEVIKNRVVSYWPIGEQKWERRSLLFDAYGDGGIITTVKDLAKWDQAFYTDLLGVDNFAQKMYQQGHLNDDTALEYARALQVGNYKGVQLIHHNGGMLGFRVDMLRFPEQQSSIILLANSAYTDPTGKALEIADILLKDQLVEEVPKDEQAILNDAISISSAALKEKEGYYWTDEANYYRSISFSGDSLFIDAGNPNYKNYLLPIGPNEYTIQGYSIPTRLEFKENALRIQFQYSTRNFRRFDPTTPQSIEELKPYIGSYESKELKCSYHIFEEDQRLFFKINQGKALQIFPKIQNPVIWNGNKMFWIGFGEIKFEFDHLGMPTGLSIGDQRVSGVFFHKT